MDARAGGAQRALLAAFVAGLFIFIATAVAGGSDAAAKGLWVRSQQSAREAGDFWTLARMREARPLELTGAAVGLPARGVPESGKARRLAGQAPEVMAFGADFDLVPDPTAPGFRVHGAIFISLGIFGYGRCSGTAVRSRNESLVFTAAHCLHTGGSRGDWIVEDGGVFVPGYRYGQRPFGVFPIRWSDTAKQWRSAGSENFDVGAVVVGRNQRGQSLTEAVGGAGIAWNLKANQVFDVHGYPAAEPFDGETQRVCRETSFLGHDPGSFVAVGPLNLGVACGVTGGASGGGWMIEGEKLNSVTDYSYFDEASPVYGPYFGTEVARLYGRAMRVR